MKMQRFASNAVANLMTGVSATIFQVGITAIAARSFTPDNFAVWALAMSLAALVPLFAANLATIVARRLLETDSLYAPNILQASTVIAKRLVVTALGAVLAISAILHFYSSALGGVSLVNFMGVVAILAVSQLWQISLQPNFGWHFAQEKNWHVAVRVLCARLFAVISMALVCWKYKNQPHIAAMAIALGIGVGIYILNFQTNSMPLTLTNKTKESNSEYVILIPLLQAFAIWSICSAVIQSGLPGLMAVIAPEHFNAFYLAYTLNLVVVGTISAAASAMVAPLARQRLNGSTQNLVKLLVWAPIQIGSFLFVFFLLIWYSLPTILPIWSPGMATYQEVRLPLFWLAFQTMARSMTIAYSAVLSSAGSPAKLVLPSIFEIGVTLSVAVPAGLIWGDKAFLATLAAAGAATALLTAWTTLSLNLFKKEMRTILMLYLILAQILVLGILCAWGFSVPR